MALLSDKEIRNIVDALIESGLDTAANRGALFQFINPAYVAIIPRVALPAAQLLIDLGHMNNVERLAGGNVPLETYLQNATLLLFGMEKQLNVIRSALDQVSHKASGAPRVDLAKVPETQEKIVHQDDMVPFAFMEGGVRAAVSVMKLLVPSYLDGKLRLLASGSPMKFLGTGWLLTESLVMTNHHVINARQEGEVDAAESDLKLQAQATLAQLDFDADVLAGTETTAKSLEAWNKPLDYAVLRIPPTGRKPLVRAAAAIKLESDPIPVNIIQHPGGRSKRYGIRNNLVSASTDTELRYFTDTERGSSGSPVFNDLWQVVALHRASAYVANVQFQGKSTAYVNIGTHLPAIMKDILARYPNLAAEIGA